MKYFPPVVTWNCDR